VNKPSTAAKAKPAEKGTGEKGWVRQERIRAGHPLHAHRHYPVRGLERAFQMAGRHLPDRRDAVVRAASALVGTSLVILPVTALRCSAPSGCAPTWCAGYRNPARRPSW